MVERQYIAHVREQEPKVQFLEDHLTQVAELAAQFAQKLNVSKAGEIIGLLHDFGKYSESFQQYLGSATGRINPDEDEYVDHKSLKGKIDHSTAGAQWIWEHTQKYGEKGQLLGQILALCIASHHSGLIDCLAPDGKDVFLKRMNKQDTDTHKNECLSNASASYLAKLTTLSDKATFNELLNQIIKVDGVTTYPLIQYFNRGFLTRMLFSCLIDADCINSADFEQPDNALHRSHKPIDWSILLTRMEQFLASKEITKPVDQLRKRISDDCVKRAIEAQGIYTLTVPTGGGKTYTSLRYALHHAATHQLDRIIYVIPFTSIIEQNAIALRKAIEDVGDEYPWILEQHSNLEPEQQTWHSKLVGENWDSPIVMITMAQFLEVLFSAGTRGVRKLHQLARSVLIFDEIQTLPIRCVHLFCNAINFLTAQCHTTAVLCTATQPLLGELKSPEKGQLNIAASNELIPDVRELFADLQRVEISNKVRQEGWTEEQIVELALNDFNQLGSCLIIANTKSWARSLYQQLKQQVSEGYVFHLSTGLCPAHRKAILDQVRECLDQKQKVICVSTQLIEAGVDVDFASVIRFLAGLDSIAQAAGRCNRHGERGISTVHVVNPVDEKLDFLPDIAIGAEKARRVLDENHDDFLSPAAISQYFKYYFYERATQMSYPVSQAESVRQDSLLNMLAGNDQNIGKYNNSKLLRQSFMSAAELFKAIDSPTKPLIVPYGKEGADLIAELGRVAKEFNVREYRALLRQAQKYSVNVFAYEWDKLKAQRAVHEIQPDEQIYYLDEQYYDDHFGISMEVCRPMSFQCC